MKAFVKPTDIHKSVNSALLTCGFNDACISSALKWGKPVLSDGLEVYLSGEIKGSVPTFLKKP